MSKGIGRRDFWSKGVFWWFFFGCAEGYACISSFNASDRVSNVSFPVLNEIERKTQTKAKFSDNKFFHLRDRVPWDFTL